MKKTHCTYCGSLLELDGSCVSCPQGIRQATGKSAKVTHINRGCPWNDHGVICGAPGSMSDSVVGGGPWYCSEHYWQLKGRRICQPDATKPHVSFRERWYAERSLPYEPPEKNPNLQIPARFRVREPGDDDEPIAA